MDHYKQAEIALQIVKCTLVEMLDFLPHTLEEMRISAKKAGIPKEEFNRFAEEILCEEVKKIVNAESYNLLENTNNK